MYHVSGFPLSTRMGQQYQSSTLHIPAAQQVHLAGQKIVKALKH
jgi:hypothetical protein